MDTVDTNPANLNSNDNINQADGIVRNDQDKLPTRNKRKHKKSSKFISEDVISLFAYSRLKIFSYLCLNNQVH